MKISESENIRIAIIDDHELVRRGFREIISEENRLNVVLETEKPEDLFAFLREKECDLVLLDIALPTSNGVDVLRTIRQRFEKIGVLVLSNYPEDRYALSMIRHGADGYLCKDCGPDELINAIYTIAKGQRYISPRTAEILANVVAGVHEVEPHQNLSERELQVFLRLSQGWSVSAIAEALHLSAKTITTYRARVLEKLGLNSNAQLASYAVQHGLMSVTDGESSSAIH